MIPPLRPRRAAGLPLVARFLERDRSKPLPKPPALKQGLGTDGGPILLLAPASIDAWRGTPADYGKPGCDPTNDYDRACDASKEGRVAVIDVGGATALVLPEQHCSLATVKSLAWIVIRGDEDAIVWNALGPEAVPFEPTGAPGKYSVEELFLGDTRGSAHIVQLRPHEAPAKKMAKSKR